MMDKKDAIDYLLYMKHDVQAGSPVDVAIDMAIEVLKQPTIEPEVRHGWWETIDPSFSSVYCSECGAAADKYLAKRYKGCPFCLCVMSATGTNVGGKGGNG